MGDGPASERVLALALLGDAAVAFQRTCGPGDAGCLVITNVTSASEAWEVTGK